MVALGVNIDHVATVREARRTYEPDPVWAAVAAELGGADVITVHLREDRRHIRDEDVQRLRACVQVRLNLEMAPTEEMVRFACSLRPEMVTLVPEGRAEVTTERGLPVQKSEGRLREVVAALHEVGVRVSLFVDAEVAAVEAAARVGADVCEVHTGPYAEAFRRWGRRERATAVQQELARVRAAGAAALAAGMGFNAGHGLTYANVGAVAALPGVEELHIGHSIVARAIFVGLTAAVREMKERIAAACRGGGEEGER
ncbi:MAG: pyridoxine 5'-phosphate synthase [Hydrogenophilus sp.]|nr:pyridoxine 5'-phosphate synthase [Hydrogenophilus sp.]